MRRPWSCNKQFLHCYSALTTLLYSIASCQCIDPSQWSKHVLHSVLRTSESCTIPRIPLDSISKSEFLEFFQERSPVVLEGSRQHAFSDLTEKEALLKRHGSITVTLSSANTFSHTKTQSTLANYINTMTSPSTSSSRGNETFYMFGPPNELSPKLASLVAKYQRPEFAASELAFGFGIGASGSGVPFHVHGQGFSEVIHGGKRWFLQPPDRKPDFLQDDSVLSWVENLLPKHSTSAAGGWLEQCDIGPGDLLYFPSMWWHAVINLSETVFVSSFEQDNAATSAPGLWT